MQRARVHLSIPDNQLFVDEEDPAKASVWLQLRTGTKLTGRQVSGIVHLISSSVDGLTPENRDGDRSEWLSAQRAERWVGVDDVGVEPDVQGRQREAAWRRRSSHTWRGRSGAGRCQLAAVQMEYDFSSVTAESTVYNPSEVKLDKLVAERDVAAGGARERGPGGRRARGGTPGSDTKTPGGGGATTSGAGADRRIDTQTTREYALPKTVQMTQQTAPVLERISVAVLVDWAIRGSGRRGRRDRTSIPRA